jgi:hypothetical protein
MAVQMTRAEYEAKYGAPPAATSSPVRMTRAEYEEKYGAAPATPAPDATGLKAVLQNKQQQRAETITEAVDAKAAGKQGTLRTLFQIGGQLVGSAVDPVIEAAKAATPSPIKKGLGAVLKPIGASLEGLGKEIATIPAVQRLADSDQGAALDRDVQAFQEYLNLVPVPKGVSAIAKTAPKAAGAVTEKVGMAVAPMIGKAQQREITWLADRYREVATGAKPTRKILQKSEARGKDPAQFLAERNIRPDVRDGKVVSAEQADKLHASADPLNEHLDLALAEIEQGIPRLKMADLEEVAVRSVRTDSNIAKNIADKLEDDIRAEFATYRKNYGEEAGITQVQAIKKGKWSRAPFDSTKPLQGDVNYAIGKAAKEAIEKAVPEDAFSVRELNSHIGDILDAEKFLRSLDGRTVKGGRLGKYFGRTFGAMIGSNAGPLGTFFGTLGGDAVIEVLQRSTFSSPLKQLILRNLQKANPAEYQRVLDYMRKAGLERETRPLLPAPKPGPILNEGRPIPVLPPGRSGDYIGPDTAVEMRKRP